jgi:hypothetical protein
MTNLALGIRVRKVRYNADAIMQSVGWKGWDAWQVLYDVDEDEAKAEVLSEHETEAAADSAAQRLSDDMMGTWNGLSYAEFQTANA